MSNNLSNVQLVKLGLQEAQQVSKVAADGAEYWHHTWHAEFLTDDHFRTTAENGWRAQVKLWRNRQKGGDWTKVSAARGVIDAALPLVLDYLHLLAAEECYTAGLTKAEIGAVKRAITDHMSAEEVPEDWPNITALIADARQAVRTADTQRAYETAKAQLDELQETIKTGHYYLTQEQAVTWHETTLPALQAQAEELAEQVEALRKAANVANPGAEQVAGIRLVN